MDIDAFKTDLRTAFARFPKEVLEVVPLTVMKHLPILEKVFPAVQEDLARHIGAAMAEYPFTMDKEAFKAELMKAMEDVLGEMGVVSVAPPKV